MEINTVDIIEFLCLNGPVTNNLSAHWVRPFWNFEDAKYYVYEVLKSEGYSLNIISDLISEEAFWDGNKLLDSYVFYETFDFKDWNKIYIKRYTGYKIVANDDNNQTFKKIIITIQTENM